MLLMQKYDLPQHINVGAGYDVPIKFLAKMIADIVGYEGEIVYNREYPNGTPKKLLDSSKIRELGWEPSISMEEGVKSTYKWFVENYENIRK
jgi:GDP-L-fucose synthase